MSKIPPQKFWLAAQDTEELGRVYLLDYAAYDEREVGAKIMHAARSEGFVGSLGERLKQLGWAIVPAEIREAGNEQ